jgi:hypothetical protein
VSVGPLSGHKSFISGNVQVTLVDGEGNIKSMQVVHNTINAPYIMSAFYSAWMGGNGLSVCARYIYLMSWGGTAATLSSSFSAPFSTYAVPVDSCAYASAGTTANPLSASANPGGAVAAGVYSWAVSGTFCFSGTNGLCSVGGACLVWNPSHSALAIGLSESWFAQASFAILAITSVDKLSIVWAFCMSTSTAGA